MGIWDGGCCPHTDSWLHVVQQRALLPIIQQHTAPDTVIHSQWRSYTVAKCLYMTVNHSVEFVDSVTRNIESYWNRVKMKLKRMKGCRAEEIAGYLDEFMERFGKTAGEALDGTMHDISQQYPVQSVCTLPSPP